MTTQPSNLDVAHLLAELRSSDFDRRLAAVKSLAAAKVDTDEVIAALKSAAETDASAYVREAAHSALNALGPAGGALEEDPAPPMTGQLTRNDKIRELVIGFVGWNLISGLIIVTGYLVSLMFFIFLMLGFSTPILEVVAWLPTLFLLANPIVLIVLAFRRRWVAVGMLAALAVNAMLLNLAMDGSYWGYCYGSECLARYLVPYWLWLIQ